jgi:hypothetical protein
LSLYAPAFALIAMSAFLAIRRFTGRVALSRCGDGAP